MSLEQAARDAIEVLRHRINDFECIEIVRKLESAFQEDKPETDLAQQDKPLQRFISTEQDHPEDRYAHSQMPDVKEGQCQYCGNFDPPAQQEKQSSSVFLQNLHYFFGQTDGTYKWPEGGVGDLLRQAKREIEQQEETVPLSEYKELQKLVTSQGIRLMEYKSQQEKPEPVDGVVIREGSPTLLRNKDIKPTDERLYTEQPPRREWVELTDSQVLEAANKSDFESMCTADDYIYVIARSIESKLKELNHGH